MLKYPEIIGHCFLSECNFKQLIPYKVRYTSNKTEGLTVLTVQDAYYLP
jgi:hypothetical protein